MAKKTLLFVFVLIGVWFAGKFAYRIVSPEGGCVQHAA
jgi:hypothetical protein